MYTQRLKEQRNLRGTLWLRGGSGSSVGHRRGGHGHGSHDCGLRDGTHHGGTHHRGAHGHGSTHHRGTHHRGTHHRGAHRHARSEVLFKRVAKHILSAVLLHTLNPASRQHAAGITPENASACTPTRETTTRRGCGMMWWKCMMTCEFGACK